MTRALILLTGAWMAIAEANAQGWRTTTDTDRMTGQSSRYAISASVEAEDILGWPYTDVRSWIGVGCNDQDEWAFIGFSESPNLMDEARKADGMDHYNLRVQWDDDPDTTGEWRMTQRWGGQFLHIQNDRRFIERLRKKQSLRLELVWYGEGRVTFAYPLAGSGEAIGQATEPCLQAQRAEAKAKEVEEWRLRRLKDIDGLIKQVRDAGQPCIKYTRAYGSQSAPGEKVIVLTCDGNSHVYGVGPTAVWAVRGGRE